MQKDSQLQEVVFTVQVCCHSRLFGLKTIIKSKEFDSKEKADKFIEKSNRHPRRFVWAVFENDREVFAA